MPDQLFSLVGIAQIKLFRHDLGVDANSHGGDLKGLLEERIPNEDISIQPGPTTGSLRDPIIVVGRTTIMTELPIFLVSSNAHEEDGTVLLRVIILAFLGGQIRMSLEGVIAGDEGNFLGEFGLNTEFLGHLLFRFVKRGIDRCDGLFQVILVAIFEVDVLLPIELIDVERMGVIDIVIAAKSAHIGDDALSCGYIVVIERPALPLGKREGYLELDVLVIAGGEGGRTLDSVEVVVES
mmetsp:Transcript_14363/g.21093  ORF Transcript_14363/g.21093 Transcript_14363/m.21093 type:complete len:238 (+) Transcript_14363:418-1131(+)